MKKISQSIKEETDDDLKRELGEEYFTILKRFWDMGMNLARTELPDGSFKYDISYTIDPTLWKESNVEARRALRAKEKSSTYSTNSLDEAIRVGLAMSSSRPDWAWAKNYTNKLPLHMSTLHKYIKLANLLDDAGLYDAAKIVDSFVQHASLELEMEKEVEVSEKDEDDDDGEEKETKKKKITLSFD